MKYFKHTKEVQKMKHTSLSPSPSHTHSLMDGNILSHLFSVSVVRKQCTDTGEPPPNRPAPCSLFSGGCFPEVAGSVLIHLFGCAGSPVAVQTFSSCGEATLELWCVGFTLLWLSLWSTGSRACRHQQLRHTGSVVVA